jgi:hypothetical protein
MRSIRNDTLPCPFRLELLAAFERILCYCHTGNTAVLATSLMNPLFLSKGVLRDGFPALLNVFARPTISSARSDGFRINRQKWPSKDGYPAVASKRAQILTYSLEHFMVSAWVYDTFFIRLCLRWGIFLPFSHRPYMGDISSFLYTHLYTIGVYVEERTSGTTPRIHHWHIRGTVSPSLHDAYTLWAYTRYGITFTSSRIYSHGVYAA